MSKRQSIIFFIINPANAVNKCSLNWSFDDIRSQSDWIALNNTSSTLCSMSHWSVYIGWWWWWCNQQWLLSICGLNVYSVSPLTYTHFVQIRLMEFNIISKPQKTWFNRSGSSVEEPSKGKKGAHTFLIHHSKCIRIHFPRNYFDHIRSFFIVHTLYRAKRT